MIKPVWQQSCRACKTRYNSFTLTPIYPINMKRFLVRIAIALLGNEILTYFEEQAKLSPYENMPTLVARIKALFDDVPVSVWQSLRDETSKQELLEVYRKHDQGLALAAYDLGVEFTDQRIQKDGYFLAPFENAAYDLGKSIVRIYTDDDPDNREALERLFFHNSHQLQLLAIDQLIYTLDITTRLADEQKKPIRFSLNLIKNILDEAGDVHSRAIPRSLPR